MSDFNELKEKDLRKVSGAGSMNFPCPKCGGPGYICNGHYWCDDYRKCNYNHSVVGYNTDGKPIYWD